MSQFFATLTAYGEAKLANCTALGIPFDIAKMSVGDGNGAVPVPDRLRTALVREVRRAPLNSLTRDSTNTSQLIAEQVIPENEGGWFIREMGLHDEAGGLVAYSNAPETYKPLMAEGSGRTQVLRMVLLVSSDAQVTLKVDPSVVLATRDYVSKTIGEELAKLDGKQSVLYTTTGNIVLSGLGTQAGGDWPAALPDGARILAKNQTDGSKNGIYLAGSGTWARAADADSSIKVTPGLFVTVEQGATLADTTWNLITDAPITLGSTPLAFERLGGKSGVTPGTFNNVTVDAQGRVIGGTNAEYSVAQAAIQGGARNLIGSAPGNSAVLTYSASEILTGDGTGIYQSTRSWNGTINMNAAGAGGLDAGAVAASTKYHSFAITKPDGTKALLASLSATTPILPSGYTKWARIGSFTTDNTANKYPLPFSQFGNRITFAPGPSKNLTSFSQLTNGVVGTYGSVMAAVSVNAFVPSTARKVGIILQQTSSTNGGINVSSNSVTTAYTGNSPGYANMAALMGVLSVEVPFETQGTVYISAQANTNSYVTGYEENF